MSGKNSILLGIFDTQRLRSFLSVGALEGGYVRNIDSTTPEYEFSCMCWSSLLPLLLSVQLIDTFPSLTPLCCQCCHWSVINSGGACPHLVVVVCGGNLSLCCHIAHAPPQNTPHHRTHCCGNCCCEPWDWRLVVVMHAGPSSHDDTKSLNMRVDKDVVVQPQTTLPLLAADRESIVPMVLGGRYDPQGWAGIHPKGHRPTWRKFCHWRCWILVAVMHFYCRHCQVCTGTSKWCPCATTLPMLCQRIWHGEKLARKGYFWGDLSLGVLTGFWRYFDS